MRLRFRVFVVVVLTIGFIFLFNGLNTDYTKDYRQKEDRQTVYFTPNNRLINGKTSSILPVYARNYSHERIIYNRVPKCGSRSVLSLFKVLAPKNKFRVIEPASNYPYQIKRDNQHRISQLMSALRTPFVYHRHMHYIDFSKFDGPQVSYINLIRDPVARAVSHFYFRRYGDRALNQTRSNKPVYNQAMTYDECVLKEHSECVGNWGTFFIVPFFCGQETKCRSPTKWALEQAKKNVLRYLVVGVLEEYDDFIKVLEKLLPDIFHGAYKQSKTPDPSYLPKSVMSETRRKQKPSKEVIAIARKNMMLEYEFYDFVKRRFHALKASLGIE